MAVTLTSGAATVASNFLPVQIPCAQATLYFPPSRKMDWHQPQADYLVCEEPRDWARSVLSSSQIGEQVRRVLGPSASPELTATCSLLTDSRNLTLRQGEPNLLTVVVATQRSRTAFDICQATVAFLKTELLIERSRRIQSILASRIRAQAEALESQERAENQAVRQVADFKYRLALGQTAVSLSAPLVSDEPIDAVTRRDFLDGLAATRALRSQELSLALQAETTMPGFTVIEPTHLVSHSQPAWYAPMAAVFGAILGFWASGKRR